MKISLSILFVCFSLQLLLAQEPTVSDEPIVEMKDADIPPMFYAGDDALYDFIKQNFKKPEVPELIGKVFVSFIVEIDGTLTDIYTTRDIGFGTGAEAERVMQLSPKWIPGRKEGKVVRVKYYLPIPISTN
ncbi:MAG: energy transducer TonB [Bacteroidetes bacterium]|nr:energy transducer TonB [Bacteroidota bacterium]